MDLELLLNKYSKRQYARKFSALTEFERNTVFLQVVSSSGRSNPKVNFQVKRMNGIGRGLWVLTACLAIYNISNATNKLDAAGRETTIIGDGFAGGAAGGAIAGIWFGAIGVAIGIIVGGTLGAIMSDQIYVELSGQDGQLSGILFRDLQMLSELMKREWRLLFLMR